MNNTIDYKYTIKGIIIICLAVVLILICGRLFYKYKYGATYDINYKYKGIKYQINNVSNSIPVEIVIKGKYQKGFHNDPDLFEGDIIIDGVKFKPQNNDNEYAFNNYLMTQIKNVDTIGSLFITDMFKEITIEISVLDDTGGRGFNYNNGWLISAPAENREEAISISNKLIKRQQKDLTIK